MDIHSTIVWTAVVLWFAQGWYLNTQLDRVHQKLDKLLSALDRIPQKTFIPGFGYQDE